MKRTFNYKLPKLEEGDMLYKSDEIERFYALDLNLASSVNTCGSGVLSGWEVKFDVDNLRLTVTSGSGIINGIFVSNNSDTVISSLTPGTMYYVYAELIDTSSNLSRYSVNIGYQTSSLENNKIELARISVT